MEYFFYCRDAPGTGALREELTVEAMLADALSAPTGPYASVEIHHWRFGGRPSR